MVIEHTLYKFKNFYNLLLFNLWPGICFFVTVPWVLVKNLYSSVTGGIESCCLMVLLNFISLPIFCLVFLSFFFDLTIDRLKKTKTRRVFLARREMHACWWWWSECWGCCEHIFRRVIWTMACFPLLLGAQFYLEPCSLPALILP